MCHVISPAAAEVAEGVHARPCESGVDTHADALFVRSDVGECELINKKIRLRVRKEIFWKNIFF